MKNRRLLIIDDDTEVCRTLKHIAERSGFDVITTDSAITFFEQLALFEPGIIIVDLIMPDQSGVQLMGSLAELNSQAKIVIISGQPKEEIDAAAALAAARGLQVLATLEKPFSVAKLKQILTVYLNSDDRSLNAASQPRHVDSHYRVPSIDELLYVIEEDLITLNYQPKLNCQTGGLLGFEALARWDTPELGMVRPSVFIPLAESNYLISLLTLNVARKAIQWLSTLRRSESIAGCKSPHKASEFTLSLNVSAKGLADPDMPDQLEQICAEYMVSPHSVILELREPADGLSDELLEILKRFRSKQFRLSIDDFGTGHLSIKDLVRLRVNELKIDHEFISTANSSKEARLIIESIIDLSRNLGMDVVAEGVETERTRQYLNDIGCTAWQGYLMSPPLDQEGIAHWTSRYCAEFSTRKSVSNFLA